MERTVRLEVPGDAAGGEVAAHVALALAVKSGLPPLAADRVRSAVGRATRVAASPVNLEMRSVQGELTVCLSTDNAGVLPDITDALERAGTVEPVDDGTLRLQVRRARLTGV